MMIAMDQSDLAAAASSEEAPAGRDLEALLAALGLEQPPQGVAAAQLFDKVVFLPFSSAAMWSCCCCCSSCCCCCCCGGPGGFARPRDPRPDAEGAGPVAARRAPADGRPVAPSRPPLRRILRRLPAAARDAPQAHRRHHPVVHLVAPRRRPARSGAFHYPGG